MKELQAANKLENFLSDIGPEVAFRLIDDASSSDRQVTVPAKLYRALIAIILRAGTHDEAAHATDALAAAAKLPTQTPGAQLGFTSHTDHSERAAVLQELLKAVVFDQPLSPHGAALTFYANAGRGVGDASEFANVDPGTEGRPACVTVADSVDDVRRHSVVQVVNHYAQAVERGLADDLISQAMSRTSPVLFVQPYLTTLPLQVHTLPRPAVAAMHKFYTCALRQLSPQAYNEACTCLVGTFSQIPEDNLENLGQFLSEMIEQRLVHNACRTFLRQRFGVRDERPNQPLTLRSLLDNYFPTTVKSRNLNVLLAAVQTALILSWLSEGGMRSETLSHSAVQHFTRQLQKLTHVASTLAEHSAPQQDIMDLKTALTYLSQRLIFEWSH